jgi:hypothetical protein
VVMRGSRLLGEYMGLRERKYSMGNILKIKNDVFLDVTPSGPCKNRCFGGT